MMGKASKLIETGAIIGRARDAAGVERITAAVTMTAADWDNLTADYAGFGFRDDAIPLDERISYYLAIQVSCRKSLNEEDEGSLSPFDADLDDDVPF